MSIDWTKEITVADKQAAEAEAVEAQLETVAKNRATELAQRKAADELLDTLPDEDVETLTYLYPQWEPGMVTAAHDAPPATPGHRKLRHKGVLYKVNQGHTTQDDWPPDATPALFTRYRDPAAGPQLWVQPTGAHDAYAQDINWGGAEAVEVKWDNPNEGGAIWLYRSKIAGNTAEPGRDGTFDRYWEPVSAVT